MPMAARGHTAGLPLLTMTQLYSLFAPPILHRVFLVEFQRGSWDVI